MKNMKRYWVRGRFWEFTTLCQYNKTLCSWWK